VFRGQFVFSYLKVVVHCSYTATEQNRKHVVQSENSVSIAKRILPAHFRNESELHDQNWDFVVDNSISINRAFYIRLLYFQSAMDPGGESSPSPPFMTNEWTTNYKYCIYNQRLLYLCCIGSPSLCCSRTFVARACSHDLVQTMRICAMHNGVCTQAQLVRAFVRTCLTVCVVISLNNFDLDK